MSDLELVRELYPERAIEPSVRDRVRSSVASRTHDRRGWGRRRLFVPALGLAAAAAVASAFFVFGGTNATPNAAAGRLLRQAAVTARQQPGLGSLGPDQYLYTKSTDAYLSTYAYSSDGSKTFSVLVPHVREIWLRRDGTGWLHQVGGTPRFLSERDREKWVAAGKPELGPGSMDTILQNSDGPTAPMASLDLPADPDALYAKLHHDAEGYGDRTNAEMFVMIGDDLRENYTTPAQRAALFEVASRVPGIQLVHGAKDAVGRVADGVAIDDRTNNERMTLLFDPQTRAMLGEQDVVLAGNSLGFPQGTVIGQAAYVEQKIVDSVPSSVLEAAK